MSPALTAVIISFSASTSPITIASGGALLRWCPNPSRPLQQAPKRQKNRFARPRGPRGTEAESQEKRMDRSGGAVGGDKGTERVWGRVERNVRVGLSGTRTAAGGHLLRTEERIKANDVQTTRVQGQLDSLLAAAARERRAVAREQERV